MPDKMKHTPGEWSVENDTITSKDGDIARLHYQSSRSADEHEANGKLIATSPKLLSSLVELTDWMRDHTGVADGTHEMLVRACNNMKEAGHE